LTGQVAAAVQGFIWPKVFWDFLSKSFDEVVKPVPILQTINLLAGLLFLAWEWPFHPFVGMRIHRSIKARLLALTFAAFAASLLYQATDAAMYYIIGIGVYSWAYYEGDVRL
jgi:hypothetical protein